MIFHLFFFPVLCQLWKGDWGAVSAFRWCEVACLYVSMFCLCVRLKAWFRWRQVLQESTFNRFVWSTKKRHVFTIAKWKCFAGRKGFQRTNQVADNAARAYILYVERHCPCAGFWTWIPSLTRFVKSCVTFSPRPTIVFSEPEAWTQLLVLSCIPQAQVQARLLR